MAAIKFDMTGDNHNLLESFNGVKRGVRDMSNTIEQEGISIEKMFDRIKTAAALSISGLSAKEFVQQVASVRGEFQKLEVAFTTMLGSADKANALINQLVQTAATTPFDLQGVAGGAKQLLAYGIAADEVNDTLIHLGDIAAGLSLPLNDLVYLYGSTMTQGRMFTMDLRQFMGRGIPLADELAKQFGVAKSEVAGLVSAGKVGAEDFKKAIMSMSSEGGKFSGLMEAQSKTISGQISNLEDAVDMMFNEIGKNTQDIISGGIEMAASLVENWKTVGAAILAVVEAVGIYKATLATMAAVNRATTNIGYNAEISELSKIVPMKEAEANADLQVAVAEGKLTQSKASQIASLRAEAAEELKALTIKETAAKANYQMAVEQHLIAKRNMAVAQSQVKIALESGTADEIAAAKKGAATAKQELQTAAIAKNTASKELNTISTKKNAISNGLDAASSTGATTATGVLTAAKLSLKRAIDMVNASFLASPIFWIAAAIAGVTFAVYKLVTAETAEEKARRKANEQMDEFNKKLDEQNQQVEKLIGIIQNETATEYQRLEAYEKLKKLMPSLTDKYSQAEIAELDLAEAQKDMNKSMDEAKFDHAKKEVEKYKESIEMLTQQMLDDAKSGGKNSTYYSIQISYNEASLKEAERQLNEILALRAKLAEESRPIEVRLKEAQENEQERKKIFDFYDEAITLAARWKDANDNINFVTGQSEADEFFERTSKELDDLKKKVDENPYDINLRMEYDEKQRIYNEMVDMRNQWQRSGLFNIPFTFTVNYASAENALNAAREKAKGLAGQQAKQATLQEDYDAAAKAYKEAAAEVNRMKANRSAYTKAQWETAQTNLKDAKQKYSDLGGDPDGKSASKENKLKKERQQRAKEEAKYQELLKKQKEDRERSIKEMEFSTRQSSIDAMEDGTEKTIKQLALDFEKQKDAIERGYKDLKKKKIDDARAAFEANPDNKGKVFDESKVDTEYTEDETNNYKKQLEANTAEYNRQLAEQATADEQAMIEYLKSYGSFQEQKLAIAKEYAQKISDVENGSDSESTKAWKKAVLQRQADEEQKNVEVAAIEAKIDWYSVFDNVGLVMKSQLEPMLESLKKYAESPQFQKLGADKQQAIVDAMSNIRQMVGSTGDIGWKDLAADITEYQLAMQALTNAENEYKQLQEDLADDLRTANEKLQKALKGTDQTAIQAAQDEINAINNKLHTAGQSVADATDKVSSSGTKLASTTKDVTQPVSEIFTFLQSTGVSTLTELWGAFDSLRGGIDGLKALKDLSESSKDAGDAAKELADAASDTGDAVGKVGDDIARGLSTAGLIGQIVSAVLKILDVLKDGIGTLISSILDSILGAVQGILEDILSGDFLVKIGGSLIKGIGGILDSVIGRIGNVLSFGLLSHGGPSEWFTNSNAKKVADTTERLTKANEALADRIDDLKDVIGDSAGNKAINAYETALQAQNEVNENQMEILKAQMGYHSAHHSNAYYADDATIRSYNADAQRAFQAAGVTASTITGLSSIYNLTPEQLKAIKDFAPKLWEYLTTVGKYDKSEYWDAVVEQAGKAAELTETIQKNLTQTSWSSLRDGFLDTLIDMESDSKDFAKSFEDMMFKALINSFVLDDEFDEWLNGFYDKWADKIKSGSMTKNDWDSFNSEYTGMRDQKISERDQWAKAMGYTGSNPYEQDTSSGGWQTMGQETADELNGRFTALQMSGERISEGIVTTIATLTALSATVTGNSITLVEIRNLMITNNAFLEDLLSVNREYYKNFDKKLDKIAVNTK